MNNVKAVELKNLTELGWNGVDLMEKIFAIDYSTFDNLNEEDEGNMEQWIPIFLHHPDTWRVLLQNEQIIGYWYIIPLFEEEYKNMLDGKITDADFHANMVNSLELPGVYDVYFSTITLKPEFRTAPILKKLIFSFIEVLEKLAQEGVYINNIVTWTYSEAGESLAKGFHLKNIKNHNKRGKIYNEKLINILQKSTIFSNNKHLIEKYSKISKEELIKSKLNKEVSFTNSAVEKIDQFTSEYKNKLTNKTKKIAKILHDSESGIEITDYFVIRAEKQMNKAGENIPKPRWYFVCQLIEYLSAFLAGVGGNLIVDPDQSKFIKGVVLVAFSMPIGIILFFIRKLHDNNN